MGPGSILEACSQSPWSFECGEACIQPRELRWLVRYLVMLCVTELMQRVKGLGDPKSGTGVLKDTRENCR